MHGLTDELVPCVGEAMVDVLAERAIALLADWDTEPPVRLCEAIASPGPLGYSETTGGDCGQK